MNKVQEYFNDLAETYDNQKFVLNRETNLEMNLIAALLGNNVQSQVIDIGCGTGRLTHEFHKAGYSIDGIDLSSKMIDKSKEKYPEMADHFHCIDFYDLDNYKCDVALSVMGGVFGLIDDINESEKVIDEFMKKLNQILKDNAIAIIEFLNIFAVIREVEEEDLKSHTIDLKRSLVKYSDLLWERGFTPTELTRIANENGFIVESIFSKNLQDMEMLDINIKDIAGVVILRKSS